MANTERVCRFCLNITSQNDCSVLEEPLKHKLQIVAPSLSLTPTTEAVICIQCTQLLDDCYKFMKTCTSSNKLVKFLRNYLGVRPVVELKELIRGQEKKVGEKWPKFDHLCRTCLKSNEGAYTKLNEVRSGDLEPIIRSCLSVADENLTTNPLICTPCIETLRKVFTFLKKLNGVEQKVQLCHEKDPSNSVDLHQVLDQKQEEIHESSDDDSNGDTTKVIARETVDTEKQALSDNPIPESSKNHNVQLITHRVNEYNDDIPNLESSNCPGSHKSPGHIADWIHKLEKVKNGLNWSDATAKQKIIDKMNKLPQVQSRLAELANELDWESWKEKLISAFPEKNDFYFNVVQLVKNSKKPNETNVDYYNKILPLLQRANISGVQAVNFLLGGIGNNYISCLGRMEKFKTPEELLLFFKSHEENQGASSKSPKCEVKAKEETNKTDQPSSSSSQPGKSSKKLIIVLENRRIDTLDGSNIETTQKQTSEESDKKCPCCDKVGHMGLNCPLLRNKTVSPEESEKNQNQTNVTTGKVLSASPENSGKKSSQKETTAIKTQQSSQKCVCCGEIGHSKVDCTSVKNKASQKQSESKTSNSQAKCSFCDKSGHSSLVCPLIESDKTSESSTSEKTNIRIVLAKDRLDKIKFGDNHDTTGEDDLVCEDKTQKRCFCCDKIGHATLNCPLLESKDKKETVRSIRHKNVSQKCFRCKKTGHLKINCPEPEESKTTVERNKKEQSKGDTVANTKNDSHSSQKCSKCNRLGHSSQNCAADSKNQVGKSQSQDKNTNLSFPNKSSYNQSPKDQSDRPGHSRVAGGSSPKDQSDRPGHSRVAGGSSESNLQAPNYAKDKIIYPRKRPLSSDMDESPQKKHREDLPHQRYSYSRQLSQSRENSTTQAPQAETITSSWSSSYSNETREVRKDESDSVKTVGSLNILKCDFCHHIGHRLSECFFAKFDRNYYESQYGSTTQVSRQCLYCGKFGHLQPDCPKFKPLSKRIQRSGPN